MADESQLNKESDSFILNYNSSVWSASVNIFIWLPPAAKIVFLEFGQNMQELRNVLLSWVIDQLLYCFSPMCRYGEDLWYDSQITAADH